MKFSAVLAAIVGLAASQTSTDPGNDINILPSISNLAQLSAIYTPLSSFINAVTSDFQITGVLIPSAITDAGGASALEAAVMEALLTIPEDAGGNFHYYYFLT